MASAVAADALALQKLYYWKGLRRSRRAHQPTGGGNVQDYTWREVLDQTRRMAAHLQGLGFAPGSRIGILAKNQAHWLIADFATWMAGHVSVPLYPTLAAGTVRQILEHSEAQLLFVGKLDAWDEMKAGGAGRLADRPPADVRGLGGAAWDEIVARTQPLQGNPVRGRRRAVHDHVHVRHDRDAEGRDAQLRDLRLVDGGGAQATRVRPGHARLSYLRCRTSPSAPWSSTTCWPAACTCTSPRASRPSPRPAARATDGVLLGSRDCGSSSSRGCWRRCRHGSSTGLLSIRSSAAWSAARCCAPSG